MPHSTVFEPSLTAAADAAARVLGARGESGIRWSHGADEGGVRVLAESDEVAADRPRDEELPGGARGLVSGVLHGCSGERIELKQRLGLSSSTPMTSAPPWSAKDARFRAVSLRLASVSPTSRLASR